MKTYKISIIGSGITGQAVGRVFIKYGYPVIFFDINKNKLKELNKVASITLSLKETILTSNISYFTLPTPTINERFDGSIVFSVFSRAIKFLPQKQGYHLFIIKSTVLPGFTENLIKKYKKIGRKFLGKDYGICANPEFLRSETPEEDFEGEECPIIIGESDPRAGKILENLYRDLAKKTKKNYQILRTNPTMAEMIKYASNSLLATKISFFNQLKEVCRRLKIDPYLVVKFTLDKKAEYWYRRDFLKLGFQDECLPKDLSAFITFCKNDCSVPLKLLEVVKKINDKITSNISAQEIKQ